MFRHVRTERELRAAWRRAARDLHPDANRHDPQAEDRFKKRPRRVSARAPTHSGTTPDLEAADRPAFAFRMCPVQRHLHSCGRVRSLWSRPSRHVERTDAEAHHRPSRRRAGSLARTTAERMDQPHPRRAPSHRDGVRDGDVRHVPRPDRALRKRRALPRIRRLRPGGRRARAVSTVASGALARSLLTSDILVAMTTTLFTRGADGDWSEHSDHPSAEDALSAGKQLLSEKPEIKRIRVAGEVFARGPAGAVVEVMED